MKAGHLLATLVPDPEFDLIERERIRWALIDYMKAHKIGVPTLAERIKKSHPREMEIPWKTLQRFLGPLRKPLEEAPEPATKKPMNPTRTRDMALTICAAFAEKLPNRPTAIHALGDAFHAVYGKSPDIPAGTYSVSVHEAASEHETVFSELTLTAPGVVHTEDQKFLLAKEIGTPASHRIFDGVIVLTGSSILAVLKDRLMHTARIHGLHLRSAPRGSFRGIVYDNGPLEHGSIKYRTLAVSVEMVKHGPE